MGMPLACMRFGGCWRSIGIWIGSGVVLLHSHFQLGEDEMMLGTTDVERRERWVRPVSKSDLEGRGLRAQTTIVRFDTSGYSQYCGCLQDKHGHTGRHT